MCARKSAWDKKPEISATYTDSKARDVIAAGSSLCTDSELWGGQEPHEGKRGRHVEALDSCRVTIVGDSGAL